MKETNLKERMDIMERGIRLLSDGLEPDIKDMKRSLQEMQIEIKALKLFLGRLSPEFKKQYPEIIKKLK